MNNPLISVLLPVYNGAEYLREAVDSVLNQTYTNFELVIVNDGSTDNSLEVIHQFDDARIRVIDQTNQGLALALINAAKISSGKYLARMDQDDISFPERFAEQVNYLEKNTEVSILSSAVIYIDHLGEELGRSFPLTWSSSIKKSLLNFGCVIVHPAVMMRKIDYETVGGYSEVVGGTFTDYHLWLKFINKNFKAINFAKPLIYYRLIGSSITSQFSLSERGHDFLLRVITQENPGVNEIEKLMALCKTEKGDLSNRISVYQNSQNKLFEQFKFLGKNFISGCISMAKNIYMVYFK